ncbi:leukocyte receptor cluster member 9 [Lingula anatina]|uniref:Leukocyte receptor cluster member 9 n=1 Tax=Lingula anatina TaxID=7574 RepID=A0A1S3J2Q8_LINAN|nr:leukocyte receptor cluster member 9 [Lingula anatina]|eukprot:XP_013404139.1 leukocyte receptor cluster member 9 [Lingula anatina]
MTGSESEESTMNMDIAGEIEKLKTLFGKGVKIIKDVGDFLYVIDIKPNAEWDLTFKFQIPKETGSNISEVIARSQALDMEQLSELSKHLQEKLTGSCVQGEFFEEILTAGQEWIKSHGLEEQVACTTCKGSKGNPTCKKSKEKRKKKPKEKEEKDEKKPSMKTAMDVIKRILWDGSLDSDDFVIGYLDRFRGVIEKDFSEFSWEDIASVDYDTLAIPKHRIVYFKYKDLIVWHKTRRFDHVFGSAGKPSKTIMEVIDQYEENLKNNRAEEEEEEEAEGSSLDSDDDSDDGIEVTIDAEENNLCLDDEGEEVCDNQYWTDKLRPNHFIAVRITNPHIVETVANIQDAILEVEPRYESCIVPPNALHLTLCVLRLDGKEAIAHAVETLKSIQSELKAIAAKGIKLHLEGTGVFYGRVLYAKVHHESVFTELLHHLQVCLSAEGLPIKDAHEFVPHVTIMKTTRPVSRQLGTKTINPYIQEHFKDTIFGNQCIESIHLCAMGDERREDGFYMCPFSLDFSVQ